MENDALLTLTTDIVSAHVSHNNITAADLPQLIQTVYGALAGAGQSETVPEARPEPAVSIRSSVKPSAITCLECGAKMKMLKRHLGTDHNTTPAEYRIRWGLPTDYPMVTPEYSAKRQELAKKIGLGRKPGASAKPGIGVKRGPGRPKKATAAP